MAIGWSKRHPRAGLRFHDCRREFASQLLETPGFSVHHVRDALRHAALKTTSRYLATTIEKLGDVMQRREAHRAGFAHHSHTDPVEAPADAPIHDTENAADSSANGTERAASASAPEVLRRDKKCDPPAPLRGYCAQSGVK